MGIAEQKSPRAQSATGQIHSASCQLPGVEVRQSSLAAPPDGEGAPRHFIDRQSAVTRLATKVVDRLQATREGNGGQAESGRQAGAAPSPHQPPLPTLCPPDLRHPVPHPAAHLLHISKAHLVDIAQHGHHQALGGGHSHADVVVVPAGSTGSSSTGSRAETEPTQTLSAMVGTGSRSSGGT